MTNKFFFSLFLFVSLAGCSIFTPRDIPKETLLLNHLKSWEKFQLEGIAEISINQFRLRKNIQITKTNEAINVTLYDSGIFGLRPTPFLSIMIDSLLTVDLPEGLGELINGRADDSETVNIKKINELFATLKNQKTTIVREGKITIEQTEFVFTDKMLIDYIQLQQDEEKIKIQYIYNLDNSVDRITFFLEKEKLIEIIVDSIKYG